MLKRFLTCGCQIFLFFTASSHAMPDSHCARVLRAVVQDRLATVTQGRSSMLNTDYPLIPNSFPSIVYERMREDEDTLKAGSGFFSQFRIGEDGHLTTIMDPTFEKDAGEEVAQRWNEIPQLTQGFQHIYGRALELATSLQLALPSEYPMLAEVVFTHQIRKPSEDWHLDWYPAEYLIATQAFIAKEIDLESGILRDAWNGGTEYLLGEGRGLLEKIHFRVNKKPVIDINSTGYLFTTPTGLLAIHSGTSRVAQILGPDREYDIASPPHRGSQTPLEYRASILVRLVKGTGAVD